MTQQESITHDMGLAGDSFFSSKDLHEYVAKRQMAEIAKQQAHEREIEKARKEEVERLLTPIELTKERIANFQRRVRIAAEQGEHQILVLRFPSDLCPDRGRAINNFVPEWTDTLVGVPRQIFEVWREHLKPLGFGLRAEVLDYPNGMPGDIGLFCSW
jgi:hypothetical protein